jgi:protoporphyrinogen oxidase
MHLNDKPRKRIVVLGAGLAGLAAADSLSHNHEVIILEKEDFIGGLASSFDYKGYKIPKHYHHVFSHDNITKGYLKKCGLKKMAWKKIKMGIVANNKRYNFTNPLGLLKFDYLSFWARIRYGLFGFYVLKLMNPKNIPDSLDAETWLMRKAGREITRKLFYHLYARNKFNTPLNMISARQFAYRLKAGEALGKFGYPREGLDKFIQNLEKSIVYKRGTLIKNAKITGIDCKNKTIYYNKKKIKADIIINTIPIPFFLKISSGLPTDYQRKLKKIKYCPCVTVIFGTKKCLDTFYWLNIFNERIGMLMQHSNLYDGYDVKINWALRYGGSEEDLNLSDKEIIKEYLKPLKRLYKFEVLWSKVFKETYAEPIYDKYYSENKPSYRTPCEGIYWAGVGMTYPKIRNMNTALESGLKVARIIENDLKE